MTAQRVLTGVLAAALAAAGVVTAAPTVAYAAPADPDAAALISTQHHPGELHVRERVPADLRMPDGTPHPCAGKYLIYRDHTDPVYLTKYDGKPKMMVVAGSSVVPADKVCLRLGIDADEHGQESSRIVVGKESQWRFLGEPGRIVWYAPVARNNINSPVWAGMGAFDPAHELAQPTDVAGPVTFTLDNLVGPGRLNMFTESDGRPAQLINSADPTRRSYRLESGGHTHLSWTFTKAGIYRTTWSASYPTWQGTEQAAPGEDITWLVGSNEDVGLPASFPRTYTQPLVTAEKRRESMGLTDPHDDNDGLQGADEVDTTLPPPGLTEAGRAALSAFDFPEWGENDQRLPFGQRYVAKPGDYSTTFKSTDYPATRTNWVEVTDAPTSLVCLPTDAALQRLRAASQGAWAWTTGASGHPGFTLDLTSLPDIDQTKPVTVVADLPFEGLGGVGHAALGVWRDGTFVPYRTTLDGGDIGAIPLQPGMADFAFDFAFTAQGPKPVTIGLQYTTTQGRPQFAEASFVLLVGNATINAWRATTPAAGERLPEDSRAGETCAGAPEPDTPPVPPTPPAPETPTKPAPPGDVTPPAPQPADPADPSPAAAQCQIFEAWGGTAPTTALTSGHMDIGPNEAGEGIVRVDIPTGQVDHASGTFWISLDDANVPVDALGLPDDKRAGFGDRAFYVPSAQQKGRPWAGLSTMHYPTKDVADGMTLTLRALNLPEGGRVLVGQPKSLSGPWKHRFDTANPTDSVHFADGVHEHPATLFNKPGIYVLDYVFTWVDKASGAPREAHTRTTYAVGVEAQLRMTALAGQTTPKACAHVDPAPAENTPGGSATPPTPGAGKDGGGASGTGQHEAVKRQPGAIKQQPDPVKQQPGVVEPQPDAVAAVNALTPTILPPRVLPAAGGSAEAAAAGSESVATGADEAPATPPHAEVQAAGLGQAPAEGGLSGLVIGIIVGAGGTVGLAGIAALITALVIALRRRSHA